MRKHKESLGLCGSCSLWERLANIFTNQTPSLQLYFPFSMLFASTPLWSFALCGCRLKLLAQQIGICVMHRNAATSHAMDVHVISFSARRVVHKQQCAAWPAMTFVSTSSHKPLQPSTNDLSQLQQQQPGGLLMAKRVGYTPPSGANHRDRICEKDRQ